MGKAIAEFYRVSRAAAEHLSKGGLDWATTLPGWIRSRRAIAEYVAGKRAVYGLHCVTFLINITAHPTTTSCSSQPLSSAAVTREEKGKPRLQLRSLWKKTAWACFRKDARLIIKVSAILASANKDPIWHLSLS